MLKILIGKNEIELDKSELKQILSNFKKVVVDVGAGDGKATYRYARDNQDKLVIALEPAKAQMIEIAQKIAKRPEKGGLKNLLIVQSSIENLPEELYGVADLIVVQLPWGSLLAGIVKFLYPVLNNLVNLGKDNSHIEITTCYDTKYEPDMIRDLGLPELNISFLKSTLVKEYLKYGIQVESILVLNSDEKKEIDTSWAKKLLSNRDREIYRISANIKH